MSPMLPTLTTLPYPAGLNGHMSRRPSSGCSMKTTSRPRVRTRFPWSRHHTHALTYTFRPVYGARNILVQGAATSPRPSLGQSILWCRLPSSTSTVTIPTPLTTAPRAGTSGYSLQIQTYHHLTTLWIHSQVVRSQRMITPHHSLLLVTRL